MKSIKDAAFGLVGGFRAFTLIWVGQLISLIGSGLTGFALGVWVFQRTGSVTLFALIALFSVLPGIVISPLAGALVDRWDRRWAMILSDTGAACTTVAVAVLFFSGRLEVWHIYILAGLNSAFNAFQWPAYAASITLLVPKKQLGRVSGMVQGAGAASQILSPMLASMLIALVDIHGVLLIDFATYLFSVVTLLLVRVPHPAPSAASRAGKPSIWREAAYGWTYISARPGLLALLLFFASANFFVGIGQVMYTPLVLSFATAKTLGAVLSAGGIGTLVGSVLLTAWGGPSRRVYGVLGFWLVVGVALVLAGARQTAWFIGAGVFLVSFCTPLVNGCSQALWQVKTAPDVQGRVFSIRRMIAWSTPPLSYLLAGPLVDKVFSPLMAAEGPLASSVGRVIGAGPGRGIGLLLCVLGLFIIAAAALGASYPRLRRVEDELPDAVEG